MSPRFFNTDFSFQRLLTIFRCSIKTNQPDKKQHLKQVSNDVIDGLKQEQVSLEDLLASHIHMSVNRLFRDKQRLHELVCYSCLYRFYQFQKSVDV